MYIFTKHEHEREVRQRRRQFDTADWKKNVKSKNKNMVFFCFQMYILGIMSTSYNINIRSRNLEKKTKKQNLIIFF